MTSLRLKKQTNIVLATLVCLLGTFFVYSGKVSAVSGAQWQPGYIIDDSIFFNATSMGAADIQTFLSSKVPTCDTNGTVGPYNGYPTRAQWAAATGNPSPPYVCLKDFTQSVPATAGDSYCPYGVSGGTKSAAMIIAEVGWACQVNPQTLIVLLQKEQNLVTDDWPFPVQYRSATGYGCPDTAACDTQYYGFFNQVYNAAHQFQRYGIRAQEYNYRAGQTSFILWNVASTGCGGSNVYIQNRATAALYNYTPYQPNQAALNNLYGTGDGCSAYGNRNFWRLFNDWFGPTMGSLVKTANDNTVYLLNNTTAHPIYDNNILNDYAALGPVRITTASEINSHTAGPALGRMVGSPGGTLYLINASIKLPFTNCQSVADYGFSCSQVTYLDDLLLNKLANGPPVTPLLRAVSNSTVYYVTGGKKRPIPTWSDVQKFPIPIMNILTDSFVNQLPFNPAYAYGPGSLVKTLNSPSVYVVKDLDNVMPVTDFLYSKEIGLGANPRTIVSNYTVLGNNLQTKLQCGINNYLGTNGATYYIPSSDIMTAYGFQQSDFQNLDPYCLNVPISQQALDQFIKVPNGTIYYVSGGQKQPIAGWGVYVSHGGNSSNTIAVSDFFANSLPTGSTITQ
jgi:hypothetical protein